MNGKRQLALREMSVRTSVFYANTHAHTHTFEHTCTHTRAYKRAIVCLRHGNAMATPPPPPLLASALQNRFLLPRTKVPPSHHPPLSPSLPHSLNLSLPFFSIALHQALFWCAPQLTCSAARFIALALALAPRRNEPKLNGHLSADRQLHCEKNKTMPPAIRFNCERLRMMPQLICRENFNKHRQ